MNALLGLQDARSSRGIAARGKNVYKGASMAPNLQGLTPAITRRLQGGTSHDGPVPSRTDAGISLGNSAKKEVTAKKAMPKKHVPPKKGHLPPWLQPGFQKK